MIRQKIIDPSDHPASSGRSNITTNEIMNLTTMTGEQREAIPGLIHESRPAHKVRAPGLPSQGNQAPSLMHVNTENKKNVGVIGMRHIRGTKYTK
jgi:hypothetical protein